jgi:tetratricopeptide (TPR) repeat protein
MRPSALLLGLALCLGGPAWAAKKNEKGEAKKPETASKTEAGSTLDMAERAKVFGEVDTAYKEGRKAKAADLLVEIVENPANDKFHAEAWARLGGVLRELDLPYAALLAYEKALAKDPVLVSDSAKLAIELGEKVGDTGVLEKVFAANVGLEVDPATRSRMAYLAARESVHSGNFGTAGAILKMVRPEDPWYPEAKTLEGINFSLQGKPVDASEFFNHTDLNIARAYYAAGNFPRAIEYYAKVQRGSRDWPEAEFERAWAHFRVNDMNGALSLLQNHVSPFFDQWFYPEAWLLRIHSLFLMCKFPEASRQVAAFQVAYTPKAAELKRVAAETPDALFDQMADHVEKKNGGSNQIPAMVTWHFEAEDRFLGSLRAVRSAEDESKRLDNIAANPFSRAAKGWVADRKASIRQTEGKRIQADAQKMSAALDQMLADAELSKLDMLSMETRLYEMAAATGDMAKVRDTVGRKARVKPGWRAWPYEGEFWADEVGYYRIEAKPDCPAGMREAAPPGK